MASEATVDIAEVIETRRLGAFGIRMIAISWLVTFFDGFDMNVISFTAKYLKAGFDLDSKMLGNVFSLGILGTLAGGFLFGLIGDRYGRRPAILLATGSFSVLTLALASAQSYPQLLALRFLNGVALGGAMPLIWALNVEYVPRRMRATVVTLIMLGYGFGVAAAGPIARILLPRFDWPGVFVFGGCASAVATGLLFLTLPESLRFLTNRGDRGATISRILRRMKVDRAATPETRFVLSDEGPAVNQRFRAGMLFEGRLRWLTPLLWGAYIASSMSTFFLSSWGPLVLEEMGFSADHAAWLSSVNSLCSAAGGLLLMRFTDRHGPLSIAVLPTAAVPLLLIAGLTPMSLTVFMGLSVFVSMSLGGSHYGITSIVSLFYPSAIRANGAGWASSMAKIGSVLGPLIGGYVLASSLPVKATYALLAVCPTVYALCILAIGMIERRGGAATRALPQPAAQ